MARSQKTASFETQLGELDAIIDALERGDMPLEKMLTEYKRGMELSHALRKQLEGARQQLKVLDQRDSDESEDVSDDA